MPMQVKRKSPVKRAILGLLVLFILGVGIRFLYKNDLHKLPETQLFSMGQVAANQGDHHKASKIYRALLEKDPRHTVAMGLLVESEIQLGQYKEAASYMETLAQQDPTPQHWRQLLELYQKTGQESKARAILFHGDKLIQDEPKVAPKDK